MKHKVLCTAPFKRFPKVMDHFHNTFDGLVVEYMAHEELVKRIGEFEGLIPNVRIKVNAAVLNQAKKLKVIYQPSFGYDHIDLECLKSHSVAFNCLSFDTEFSNTLWSTAEHTLSLILALLKSTVLSIQDVKKTGSWDLRKYLIKDLRDLDVGIIGLGIVGKKVASLCNAFGANISAYDPYISLDDFPAYIESKSLDRIISESDIISIHVPLNSETKGLIAARELAMMKENSYLINTSRGGVVSEEALYDTLVNGKLAGVALDVLEGESPLGVKDHPLVKYSKTHHNIIITPHLAGASYSHMESIFLHTIDELNEMLDNS